MAIVFLHFLYLEICNKIIISFLETLVHVAKTVAHVDLSEHLVDLVFTLFDENSKYLDFYRIGEKSTSISDATCNIYNM